MPVSLDKLEFETAEGTWRTEYIGEPRQANGDRVTYYLRCKWVDPNNPENKSTPERRLRLLTYPSQKMIHGDYESRLKAALARWLGSLDESEAIFDSEEPHQLKVK